MVSLGVALSLPLSGVPWPAHNVPFGHLCRSLHLLAADLLPFKLAILWKACLFLCLFLRQPSWFYFCNLDGARRYFSKCHVFPPCLFRCVLILKYFKCLTNWKPFRVIQVTLICNLLRSSANFCKTTLSGGRTCDLLLQSPECYPLHHERERLLITYWTGNGW